MPKTSDETLTTTTEQMPEPASVETLVADVTANTTPTPEPSENKTRIVWAGAGTSGLFYKKLNGGGDLELTPDTPVVVSLKDPSGVSPDYARALVDAGHAEYVKES